MRIFIAHNFYQQPGGEDTTRAAEVALLRARGHEVYEYTDSNDRVSQMSRWTVAQQTIWSGPSYRAIRRALADFAPDIAHFHNTFSLISPAAYYACQRAGVPVVQTIQNYRLACIASTFVREGAICEACLGKFVPWPGLYHRCYHDSLAHSSALAAMLVTHRALRTWQTQVDAYIMVTDFAKNKLVAAGLPAHKCFVKPNFILPDPGQKPPGSGAYALFVGRLSLEKGIDTLIEAWRLLPGIPLKILGDGPLRAILEARTNQQPGGAIEWVGRVDHATVLHYMKNARLLVFPSEWYEGYPLTLTEAFACSLPVVASNLGAMATIVRDGVSGLLFTPKDAQQLAAKVQWAWEHPDEMAKIGRQARRQYEAENSADSNYETLMRIYTTAIAARRSSAAR